MIFLLLYSTSRWENPKLNLIDVLILAFCVLQDTFASVNVNICFKHSDVLINDNNDFKIIFRWKRHYCTTANHFSIFMSAGFIA